MSTFDSKKVAEEFCRDWISHNPIDYKTTMKYLVVELEKAYEVGRENGYNEGYKEALPNASCWNVDRF